MVGDKNIEPAKGFDRGADRAPAFFGRAQLLLKRNAAGGAAAFRHKGESLPFGLTVGKDDAGARLAEQADRFGADAARTSGNEGNLAVQLEGNSGHKAKLKHCRKRCRVSLNAGAFAVRFGSRELFSNGTQHARGQENDGAHQLEHAADGDADDPKRQQQQPTRG